MSMSRTRKKDSQVCRKKAPGVFTCPPSKPIEPSTVLAIPYSPASHPSLLIDSTGLIDRKIHHHAVDRISSENLLLDLTTKHAHFDTTALGRSALKYGCPVFFKNELLIFGVHKSSPNWSSVSDSSI